MTQLPRWPLQKALRWAVVWTGMTLVAGLIATPANAADQNLVPSSQVRSLLANAATSYSASVKAKATYDKTAKALSDAKVALASANKLAAPFETKVVKSKAAVISARAKYNAALAARDAIINPPAPSPSPTPSVTPTPSVSATPSPTPTPSPTATALTKAQKVALKKADEVVTARRIALSKAKKAYAAAEKEVVKPRSAAAKALAAQTTARTKYNSALVAKTSAETAYQTNLSALNAITSVTPYSGDVCLPGQRLGDETVWECGVIKYVSDGDTVVVTTTTGKAIVVRTLGVQAPEVAHLPTPAMCGGDAAETVLAKQLPIGTEVQLRSIAQGSYNDRTTSTRYYRSIIKRASDGTFSLDTADKLFSSGLAMWFPIGLAPGSNVYEPASFARYRTLVESAARAGKGLWSTSYCADPTGTTFTNQREIRPQIWAEMNPSGTDTADNEFVLVKNPATTALDLTGWKIRDTALNFFTFPKGSILRPGHVAKIYVGRGTNNTTSMTFYFQTTGTMFLNFSQSLYDTKGWLLGDGIFLVDRQGPKGSGGNTRAWFHYPCLINGQYSESCPTLEVETSTVPNLVGLAEIAARSALGDQVLRIKVNYVATTPENVGKVLSQSTASGTEVEWDTLITVSVGITTPVVPTPTPTPSPSAT